MPGLPCPRRPAALAQVGMEEADRQRGGGRDRQTEREQAPSWKFRERRVGQVPGKKPPGR